MNGFDRFKNLKPSGETKVENPYVKKDSKPAKTSGVMTEVEKETLRSGMLDGQNKHLYALLNLQAKEIKELKEDIATLFSMLLGDEDEGNIPAEQIHERYMAFKMDKRHLTNRKEKRFNGTN